MAKLSTEKVLDWLCNLPLEEQVRHLESVKTTVVANHQAHEIELQKQQEKLTQTIKSINGN